MPYCTQCGGQVSDIDVFCAKCGKQQKAGGSTPPPHSRTAGPGQPDFLGDLNPRVASMLCYVPVVGWIAAIIVLATPKFQHDRTVRFHAFQGLYLFVVWLIVDWVISPMLFIGSYGPGLHELSAVRHLLQLVVFGAWIWMIIQTSQNHLYRLPIVGELAERSLTEQR
jgi:uncharacterized membrane protein